MADKFLTIRLELEMKKKLDKEARKENRTIAGQVRHILNKWFAKKAK
jgi:predicted DNA-binding protein